MRSYDGKHPPVVRGRCGTYAGWNLHMKNYEYPCPDCRDANSERVRAWRVLRGETQHLRVPVEVLWSVLMGQTTYPLEEYFGPALTQAIMAMKSVPDDQAVIEYLAEMQHESLQSTDEAGSH